MADFNKVFVMGRLTRDPELRTTQSGKSVASFSLAVNRRYKAGQDGQTIEETHYINCTAWGRTAENIDKYFAKGRPIFVEGRLTLSRWEDKSGAKRSKLEVTVESFQFIDPGKRDDDTEAPPREQSRRRGPEPQPPAQDDGPPNASYDEPAGAAGGGWIPF